MAVDHPVQPLVFISYSHEDENFLEELLEHLKPLRSQNLLDCWSDKEIDPGGIWQQEIEKALSSTKVAVLLVSPGFLASDFIAKNELPALLNSASDKQLTILWIPVSASTYKHTGIAAYQAAHNPDEPLDRLRKAKRNEVFVKICDRILNAVNATIGYEDNKKTYTKHIQTNTPGLRESIKRFEIDKKIQSTLETIEEKQASSKKKIPLESLIPLLGNFFERMTFKGEPKIETCTSQRWTERVHSARLTYEALLIFEPYFVQDGTSLQKKVYQELLLNISKYIDRMILGLFEERKIELSEIDDLIGTQEFVIKFKENKERHFVLNDNGLTINMEAKYREPINRYLKKTLGSINKLVKSIEK